MWFGNWWIFYAMYVGTPVPPPVFSTRVTDDFFTRITDALDDRITD